MSQATTPPDNPDRRQVVKELSAMPDPVIREQCRDHFALFADIVTYNWLAPKPEQWYPVPDHALDWHDHHVNAEYSPMILAGRKHTKSTWVLCEILYKCQYNDHWGVLYWCNNAENQLPKRMAELEEMIEANLWLDNLHKGKPDQQNNIPQSVKFKQFPGNGAYLEAAGVGSGIEGSHFNEVHGDDPLKEMGDIPDEDILHYYKNVIVPMADSADLTSIVGTRKRPQDIYKLIEDLGADLEALDFDGYRLVEYPAIREVWQSKYGDRTEHLADASLYEERQASDLALALGLDQPTVSVLWPEARGPNFLTGKLARQGKAAFVREFCMTFTHVEDAIIKRGWIDDEPVSIQPNGVDWNAPPTRQKAEAYLADYYDIEGFEFQRVSVGLDPAVAEGGDNCAWGVIGERDFKDHPWPLRFPLHVSYINGIQPERMRATTADLYDRYEADVIIAEKNGLEWYMDRHVQFPNRLPIRMHNTGARKHSWQRGVPAIADAVEQGRWRFFRGDDGIEDLIDALTSLRMDDNDHLAGHTPDVVMALYMSTKGLGSGRGGVVDLNERPMSDEEAEAYERAEQRREDKEQALAEGGEIGEAILDMDRRNREFLG